VAWRRAGMRVARVCGVCLSWRRPGASAPPTALSTAAQAASTRRWRRGLAAYLRNIEARGGGLGTAQGDVDEREEREVSTMSRR
jgi:hypothetical protein